MVAEQVTPLGVNAKHVVHHLSPRDDDRSWTLWKPAPGVFQAFVGPLAVHNAAAFTPRFCLA